MKQIFNKYIIIILSFYAFWILGLPFIFSETFPKVCENISLNSDYTVEIEKPQLFLSPLPVARLKAKSISIKAKNKEDFTRIDNFETSIRLLPLVSGRVHINKIKASEVSINSVLNKELQLDKDFLTEFKNARGKCDEISISKLSASIKQPELKTPVAYKAEDIYYKRNARALKMHIKSELNVKDKISAADINLFLPKNNNIQKSIVDVKFDNFDVEPLSDYLRQYLPKELNSIKGVINVRIDKQNLDASFKNCAILMKDNAKSIIFPDELKVNSTFGITSKLINFEKIDVASKNIKASLNGSVANYLDASRTNINFDVRLNKSRVEDIVNLLPPIIVEEFNVYKLKHYKFYGDAIGNFSIKGDLVEPEINGEVFINNGILIKPIKNAAGATVKLDFTGKYVNFDVNVPAGGQERVWVKGGVELYNVKYADMHIWSTKKVDLETAEEKIIPIHEILNFIIGPVPIMDVKGDGNIDIIVKGNRKNPHVWGVLNFSNVKTHFLEIPDLVLTNAEAVLTFNDQNAEFKTKKGLTGGKPISISGICNLYGKFDFDVESKSQDIAYLLHAIETSTMIDDVKKMLPKLDIAKGTANLKLKVFGSIIDIEDIEFNRNLFSKGEIELIGNTFGVQGVNIDNTKGKINFDGTNAAADITAFIGKSEFSAKGSVKDNFADFNVSVPRLNINDILPVNNDIKSDVGNVFLDVKADYKGKVDTIEYDKVNFAAKILGTAPKNKLKLSNGTIVLKNNKLDVSNVHGSFDNSNSSFYVNLSADNISDSPKVNGNILLHNFEMSLLNMFGKYVSLPVEFEKGNLNLNCKIRNNKVETSSDLGGVKFIYTPLELPVKIVNGSFMVRNNTLRLIKLNLLADDMPLLVDGSISDIFHKQIFDIYVNSKPKQDFIDKYINKNQIYPVKIKGDIVYTLRAKGVKDNFDVKADVNMAPDSSIYHLGATVGDVENAIVLNLDTKILHQNVLKIREFSYDKIISSLGSRSTRLNMLKARGGIEVFKDDLIFHDLYIKTQNPTDARIFNIIFRKPNIKQGQFTSDLRFNGRLSNPRLIGDFHIFETNIPFLDTTMKNITFKFKDKTIDLTSKGEILNNDVSVKAVLKNKLSVPYYVEKAELNTKLLDLNYLIEKMKLSQIDETQAFDSLEGIDLSSTVINDMILNADSIHLRNIVAEDFRANASLNEKKVFNVKDFKFNIANGVLNGKFNYNLENNNTALSMKAKDIDANDLAYALFDLNNQIYGDLTGDIKLSCNGETFDNCMKTLNGKTTFNVNDGKMPKLGSLEYLLKAGNLLKGGLTSISINGVIDIITPLKTGDFSSINGMIDIKDGVAEDIEIMTRGKDLSLFITGKYNFASADADMEVFGMLSRKISTMFGPIGNLSLNTLFNAIPGVDLSKNTKVLESINKIPGIELSNKAYRKFIAEIKGNINGDDYVTNFKWINF